MQFIPYSLYPSLFKPFLFMADAESAHDLIIKSAGFFSSHNLSHLFAQNVEYRPVEVMGLKFRNPLGLAAGLDKNGEAIDFFGALGFGHIEVGTVTPLPQEGNPKPRMFRVKSVNGIINRMGFNNKGVDYLVENLKTRHYEGVLGVSIGKNETTPLDKAADDYITCMDKVYKYADYIAVNVSCPNTPDLTKLQAKEPLFNLLNPLKENQSRLSEKFGKYVPLVVKISPDLSDEMLYTVCDVCLELKIDGLTCTNTTVSRSVINGLEHASEWGGLSGEPLRMLSISAMKKVISYVKGRIPVIGVGGIFSALDAKERISNGASLIQIYSALIYKGPDVIKNIVNNI